jgi:hypothetical protein
LGQIARPKLGRYGGYNGCFEIYNDGDAGFEAGAERDAELSRFGNR